MKNKLIEQKIIKELKKAILNCRKKGFSPDDIFLSFKKLYFNFPYTSELIDKQIKRW